MAFGNLFDGYCMIHAEHATSERRPWFEQELKRVGVDRYTVVNAPQITDDDPRVLRFRSKSSKRTKRSIPARISLVDARVACLNLAQRNKWRNVVIMEDDVIFRERFSIWWSEVESEVSNYNWDILFMYRGGQMNGKEMFADEIKPQEKTRLIAIPGTIRTHCYVVREQHYKAYERAIKHSMSNGRSADSKSTFKYLKENSSCRIVATNRPLAGQNKSFKSSIRAASVDNWLRVDSPDMIGTRGQDKLCVDAAWRLEHRKDAGYLLVSEKNSIRINESAAAVVAMCDGEHTIPTIIDQLTKHTNENSSTIEKDVLEVLNNLAAKGIVRIPPTQSS